MSFQSGKLVQMWGRRSFCHPALFARGNTPTCVGKTGLPAQVRSRSRKHPHVRGEDISCGKSHKRHEETPPRAWGRQRDIRGPAFFGGNTPTCVGKTVVCCLSCLVLEKHPHVRGEDAWMASWWAWTWETPPRAWGRRRQTCRRWPRWRNTPTCVGKTCGWPTSLRQKEKHPHVRGEDRCSSRLCALRAETPPRAWGRRSHGGVRAGQRGNTPTCVGKTA